MDIKEAIYARHTVRKFQDKPLAEDVVKALQARIEKVNKEHQVNIKLVTNESVPVWGVMKFFMTKGLKNYLVLLGPDRADIEESLGYCGIDIALYAQTLGLNTWWVGGTYSKNSASKDVEGSVINGIIALGYGQVQGVPHKSKAFEDVCQYEGAMPEWFKQGVEAALLAPTAMNKQKFMITGKDNEVSISCDNGKWSGTDLGIVKYHFEVGAGKDNFQWK
ncbi:nitroreductase [Segatella bryantii]|jgi:nitroreductase|uniref:Nitroreductase n=2 Tax=Segatella bryantii TaxID=77095 RepID=A0ABX4EGU1_SEGBR|nr:nitroreductase family protein [Segatella bryantii]OYP54181.1 nitroreductase [Segatella bryantii]